MAVENGGQWARRTSPNTCQNVGSHRKAGLCFEPTLFHKRSIGDAVDRNRREQDSVFARGSKEKEVARFDNHQAVPGGRYTPASLSGW